MHGESWAESGPASTGARFSDPDVYPNTLEYWGPTGIPWYRNVQLRYTAISTDTSNLMFALARPGASGDQGVYADRIELQGIKARFPVPDFAAAYSTRGNGATCEPPGCCGASTGTTPLTTPFDLSGHATGWGWNVSSNVKFGENSVLRMQFTTGEGIQNEMNDSPVDIGVQNNFSNAVTPLLGKPIPIVAYRRVPRSHLEQEVQQRDRLLAQDNDNTDGQAA